MLKRQRTDESPVEEQLVESTRSEDFWFCDGSIVLQAENVQFKVHKGVLSRHSPIFETILSMPHTDDEPTVEECPVLNVHDDPKDVENMLTALYGKNHDSSNPLHFSIVASFVRLGTKYEIDSILKMGLARLQYEFPVTLLAWSFGRRLHTGPFCIQDVDSAAGRYAMIELALECDIPWVLPSAYYMCCLDLETTLFKLQDVARSKTLLQAVPRLCFKAHQALLEDQYRRAECMSAELLRNPDCTFRYREGRRDTRCRSALWCKPGLELSDLDTWDRSELREEELCDSCIDTIANMSQIDMDTLWDRLPSFFQLPRWEVLKGADYRNI
ncbi:hypothetical protein DFP72DRAFT_929612 [Ephemerocybe angulata]|uniref:BTB domain-containing protein n=1 Tax=Ephemerocybe angulata TaxID=980116 RepID=A0A8H6HDM2_9AGAR|nr:hypothetical protein DFP72DRAFT_929612 [Tulosesus angulatus]